MKTKKAAIVLLGTDVDAERLRVVQGFAGHLRRAAEDAGEKLKVVVGLEDPLALGFSRWGTLEPGLEVRHIWPRGLLGPTIDALWEIAGRPGAPLPHGVHFRDGISDLLDCDMWFVLGSHPRNENGRLAPVIPLRPVILVEPDLSPFFVRGSMNSDELADLGLVLSSATAAVTKFSQSESELVAIAGLSRRHVARLPRSFTDVGFTGDQAGAVDSTRRARSGWVWRPEPDAKGDGAWVLSALGRLWRGKGARERGRVLVTAAALESELLMKWWMQSEGGLRSMDRSQLSYLLEEELDNGSRQRLRTFRTAKFALHTSLHGVDETDFALASAADIPILSVDYPQAREMAAMHSNRVQWYQRHDLGQFEDGFVSIATGATVTESSGGSRWEVRQQQEAGDWWRGLMRMIDINGQT